MKKLYLSDARPWKNGLVALLLLLFFAVTATAQKVSGRVTDETGEGLPGVTVFVKGTSVGTVTDMDGRYNVAASQGQELMFSQTGMETQTVRVGSGGDVNVTLSGSITLREAVITGALGLIQDKRKLSDSRRL